MLGRGWRRWLRGCFMSGHNRKSTSAGFHGILYLAGCAAQLAREPIAPEISVNATNVCLPVPEGVRVALTARRPRSRLLVLPSVWRCCLSWRSDQGSGDPPEKGVQSSSPEHEANPFALLGAGLQRRNASPTRDQGGAGLLNDTGTAEVDRATQAMEAAKSLDGSREEPSGVGRAGCCESRRWNRGGLTWSVVTNTVTAGISRRAKSRGKPGEKSEEAIVLRTTETTQIGKREGPLLQPCRAGR